MLGTELLETLLASYAECYDIQRDYPIQDAVYPAYAKFNVTSAKYVLMKKAELWRVNCFEHAFFSVVSSLQTEDLQKLRRQITEYMEPQLVRSGAKYPPPNHMYTFLTAIFISEGRVSPEVKKRCSDFGISKIIWRPFAATARPACWSLIWKPERSLETARQKKWSKGIERPVS